jgi:hypothetical protein
MTFRDDREAAHQRAEALQQEVSQLQREVATLRAPKPPRRVGVAVAVAVLGVTFVGLTGAGMLVFFRITTHAPDLSAPVRQMRAEQERLARAAAAEQEAELRAAEAARAQEVAAEAARAQVRVANAPVATITWTGVVDTAEGVALSAGAPCELSGTFAQLDRDTQLRSLTVRCGSDTLYTAGDSPESPAPTRVGLREGPVFGAATHVYLLRYTDDSPRTGTRPKLDVSTLQHSLVLSREGASPLRVAIYVRDVSAPREGAPLLSRRWPRAPSFATSVERVGRVVLASGAAPVRVGDRCTFEARPVWEFNENCRVALRCGQRWVYGAREAGYLTCELRDGVPIAALDEHATSEGGDPRLTWRGGRIEVSDFTEAGAWRVVIGR